MDSDVVKIVLMHNIPTLWNDHDCNTVRGHRIMGTFIGPSPKKDQTSQFGLPLRLMKEEAQLLVDKGLAILVELPALAEDATDEIRKKYEELYKKLNEYQFNLSYEDQKLKIIKQGENILKGKKLKLMKKKDLQSSALAEKLTVDIVIEQEISKLKKMPDYLEFVEIHMEHPLISELPLKKVVWSYPETAAEKLCMAIFKDLWEKGYYITSGIKFGGDYLIYHDDPNSYHASFIIKCVNDAEEIYPCDLTTWIRVATSTKKTLVTASVYEDNKVHYQSFHWLGDKLST